MQNMIDDTKIYKSRAVVDRVELNTALRLANYFTKKQICSLLIKGVYDGSDILSSIHPDANKLPRQTDDLLKTILMSYIEYLVQKSSIDQDTPLFPRYFGNSGEKKLQRHIRDFTNYHDFNAIKKAFVVNQYQQLAHDSGDSSSKIAKVAASQGKSVRTITRSLGMASVASTSSMRKGKNGSFFLQFLQLLDEIVVMSGDRVLNEEEVKRIISTGFDMIERMSSKQTDVEEFKRQLINAINNRVNEIEQELLNSMKFPLAQTGKSVTTSGPLRLLRDAIDQS